jgi:hypothetical protein
VTLDDLIADYRFLSGDKRQGDAPPFAEDAELARLFHEAEEEAAIRGRLIHESQDEDICQIAVTSGTAVYSLHESLYEISYAAFVPAGGERCLVSLVTSEYLDGRLEDAPIPLDVDDYDGWAVRDDWRDATGTPAFAIQTDRSLRLVPTPNADGTLYLEGYRIPTGRPGTDPEISSAHHRQLTQWVLFRVFSVPDAQWFDPNRASIAYGMFEQYFGLRPDSDLRRATRHDLPHHVKADIW